MGIVAKFMYIRFAIMNADLNNHPHKRYERQKPSLSRPHQKREDLGERIIILFRRFTIHAIAGDVLRRYYLSSNFHLNFNQFHLTCLSFDFSVVAINLGIVIYCP